MPRIQTKCFGEGVLPDAVFTRVKLGIVAPDSVLIQRKETQITREENITAARSVRQQNISSLLKKVAFQPAGAPVKNLTDATILTTKCT